MQAMQKQGNSAQSGEFLPELVNSAQPLELSSRKPHHRITSELNGIPRNELPSYR